MKRLQTLKNERGLTLVELLAVIVILAIIAVVAFVMIGQVIENSRKDAHVANAQQMIASTKLYEAQGGDLSSGSVTLTELQDAAMIDKIYDSWTKNELITGTVTKSGYADYSVELNAENNKCNINASEEDLVADGRDNCN